ncbi:RebB family R body protein [Roseibium sp.]|uniref:RebB family R body protein n=1 Tax=Roseibium sp. TaxID=1936156 RepID=UPI003A98807B
MSASKPSAAMVDTDALVLGLSPAVATAALYGSMVHSMGILFENAISAQKLQTLSGELVVLEGILENLTATAVDVADDVEMLDPAAELAAILKSLHPKH